MKTEDITRAISFVVPILIVAGLLNQIVYYKFFNVQIADFLNAGEILILFSDDLLFYLLIAMATVTVVALLSPLWNEKVLAIKEKRWFIRYVANEDGFERFFQFLAHQWVLIAFWIVVLAINYFTDKELFNITLYVVAFSMCSLILRWHTYEVRRSMRIKGTLIKQDESFYTGFSVFVSFLFILLMYTAYDVRDVRDKYKFINTSIILNDQVITSDSTYFYIGKTDDYIFFYDKKKDETTVYPMAQVQLVRFGKVVYWQLEKPSNTDTYQSKDKKWWKIW